MVDLFDVVLVGCGFMGKEYIKSLIKLEKKFLVIGNREESSQMIREMFSNYSNIKVISGGFEKYKNRNVSSQIIITSPIQFLDDHLELALKMGFKRILIEKPGSIDLKRMKNIIDNMPNCQIYVGYNRRYYSTVEKAKEIIADDGGVLSFSMDITELIHRIDPNKYHHEVLNKWIYSMTSHLLDLGFYLGNGQIKDLNSITGGADLVPWHPNASIFNGFGSLDNNTLFVYHGNWASAGRWRLEIFTRNHLILFYPLEKLVIQKRGEMKFEEIACFPDQEIKEGIFKQTEAFLSSNKIVLPSYQEQYKLLCTYRKIAGYNN